MPAAPGNLFKWTKAAADRQICSVGPIRRELEAKPDGRWNWRAWTGSSPNPSASGVGASLGAAKTAAEQFAKRSGVI